MEKRILFALSVLVSLSLQAQNEFGVHSNTCVTYKEGNQLVGKTISDNGRSINLLTEWGDTIWIWYRHLIDVERVDDRSQLFRHGRFHFRKGSYTNLSIAFTTGLDSGPASHLHFSWGRRIREKITLGFGTGIDTYRFGIAYQRYSYLTTFAYGRVYLYNYFLKRTKPFISVKLGYGFAENTFVKWRIQEGRYRGGPMLNPSVGLHFASKGKIKVLIAFTSQIQFTTANYITREWWIPQQVLSISERNLFVRSGINLIIERW